MCQPNPQSKTNESESFVRQSFLRGHLAPAFQPPSKTCPRCLQSYTGVKTMCLPCIKAVYAEQEKDKDLSRDTYLDDCEMCKKTTLHLGPGWCVECYAASDAVFPLYCEECVVACDVPVSVKDDKGLEALQCDFSVPNDSTPKLSRWSDTHIDHPALIVSPKTEEDVQAAIRIAMENKLSIVTGGGGHGTFVRVGPTTLYLDMKNFKKIELNKDESTVKVGGGVIVREVLSTLAAEGFYTPVPNSDTIGFVGCVLGSGNSVLVGIHGFMADSIVSLRVITAEGEIVEVNSSSEGKELALFNALCGAGHGLGVITEVTTSMYPLSDLNLEEGDKIWTRTLIFPAPAIDVAAKAFLELSNPVPKGYATLAFVRSPPGTPAAGAPIIIVGYQFFGPAETGEKEAAVLFREDIVEKAVMKMTDPLPFTKMNYKNEVYNYHGGHKAIASARLYKTDSQSIQDGFNKWLNATQEYHDAQQTALIMSAHNTAKSVELTSDRFAEVRDRIFNVFIAVITQEETTRQAYIGILADVIAGYRKADEGAIPRSFPNNLSFESDLNEMFDKEKLQVLKDVKGTWDAEGVFWSPYTKVD